MEENKDKIEKVGESLMPLSPWKREGGGHKQYE